MFNELTIFFIIRKYSFYFNLYFWFFESQIVVETSILFLNEIYIFVSYVKNAMIIQNVYKIYKKNYDQRWTCLTFEIQKNGI